MPRRRAPSRIVPPALPPRPKPTEAQIAREERILRDLEELNRMLRQRALDRAVALAQQAACGHGPLVDYFVDLGTRFAKLLDAPEKPSFRVVPGGKQ